jgi:hypothetical protein
LTLEIAVPRIWAAVSYDAILKTRGAARHVGSSLIPEDAGGLGLAVDVRRGLDIGGRDS